MPQKALESRLFAGKKGENAGLMRLVGLIIALVLALGAGVVAFKLFGAREPDAQQVVVQTTGQDFETVNVLIAARPISIGEVVAPEMLDSQPWPKHLVLEGFITSPDATQNVVKMVARSSFQQGEPIVLNRLSNPNDPSFLAANLTPGMRVVTVASDAIAGIAGFVYPGDRVDVLVTHSLPKVTDEEEDDDGMAREEKESITETLLTDVRVLAVNQWASGASPETKELPSSISLEVSLADAQKLRLSQETGYLSLALRGLDEEDRALPPLTRVADTTQAYDETKDADGKPKKRKSSVIIIRGVQVTEVDVAEEAKEPAVSETEELQQEAQ